MNLEIRNIPPKIENTEVHDLVNAAKKDPKKLFVTLKSVTNEDDKEIAVWLDINEKTFRNQKNTNKPVKPILAEHIIMLISLFKHGIQIFGTAEQFKRWLDKANFHFDKKAPIHFINTISGIKFIDDRLTGIEYGDNV